MKRNEKTKIIRERISKGNYMAREAIKMEQFYITLIIISW